VYTETADLLITIRLILFESNLYYAGTLGSDVHPNKVEQAFNNNQDVPVHLKEVVSFHFIQIDCGV
jgi:hypothetical protein